MALLTRCCALLLLAGCGLGGGSGGGGDNLPVSGAGPYGKISDFELATPLDEPFLVVDDAADLVDPAPILLDGVLTLFYTRRAASGPAEIWRTTVSSLSVAPTDAQRWLADDAGGDVSSPAPVLQDGELVVYYQGDGFVGRAGVGPVIQDAADPTAIRVAGVTYLYFTRTGQPGIFLATSADGTAFDVEPAPVLLPAPGDRFDSSAVSEPSAAGGITSAGELRIALLFTGTDAEGLTAIGFAASFDGRRFTRDARPVLDPAAPAERGPGALFEPTRDLLFFSQDRSGHAAIAVATAP